MRFANTLVDSVLIFQHRAVDAFNAFKLLVRWQDEKHQAHKKLSNQVIVSAVKRK